MFIGRIETQMERTALAAIANLIRSMLRFITMATILGSLCASAYAQQGSSAALNGTVMDPSGAIVPGAVVTATDMDTNVALSTQTTGAGVYNFPALPPGRYKVTAAHAGFQQAEVNGFPLRVGQMLTVDLKLSIGQTSTTVHVSGDAQLLETSTSQLSNYVTSGELSAWPLQSYQGERDIQQLIYSSLPGTVGKPFAGSLEGGQTQSNEIYIDGAALGTFDSTELQPSQDAISEFNLQVGAMGAQYNGGGTAVTNYSIKSGTNRLHATVYEILQNSDLNANTFDDKQLGKPTPKDSVNNFGGSIGGPVFLPKIYDGRNKTFFFVAEEHDILNDYAYGGTTTLPTPSELKGDFSGFLNPSSTNDSRSGQPAINSSGNPVVDALGRPVIFGQIYNPATQRLVQQGQPDPETGVIALSTGLVRDPFQGNQISTSNFNSVASAYLKNPLPSDYTNGLVVNNIPKSVNSPRFTQNSLTIKIDHQINSAHRISFLYESDSRDASKSSYGMWSLANVSPLVPIHYQATPGKIIRASEYWEIKPTIVNRLTLGYNRFHNIYTTAFYKQNWGQALGISDIANFGFPPVDFGASSSPSGSPSSTLPSLGGTFDPFGDNSNGSGLIDSNVVGIDQISISFGNHQLTAGTEWRFYRENDLNLTAAPTFTFGNAQTDGGVGTTPYSGNAFASFLLGQVNNTATTVYDGNDEFNRREVGTFVQDDWKLSPRLTFNFGLRWEVMGGIFEAHGKTTSMNPFIPNSAAGGLPGALQFASQLGRKGFEDTDWKLILPRLGFAWDIEKNTVLRGGFGVNTQAPEGGPEFNQQYETPPATLGYSANLQINGTTNPQIAPDVAVAVLGSPYPTFTGTLPDYDPTQANDQAPPPYIRPDGSKATYVYNYNLGIEQSLGKNMMAEVNYVGNTAKRIYAYGLDQLNQLPLSDLAKYGDALLDPLSLHPEIAAPYAGFSTNNTVQQALAPFPQYAGGSVFQYDFNDPGWSRYDSLQATLHRRVANGLNLMVAYTWAKTMTNTNSNCNSGTCGAIQNVYQPNLEKAVALYLHVPQQLKITTFYNLPLGHGRMIALHGPLDWLAGGWMVSANLTYQSGTPMQISDSSVSNGLFATTRPNYTGQPIRLRRAGQINLAQGTGPQYLNPAAFTHVLTSCDLVPANTPCNDVALTVGNVPSALGHVMSPGLAQESASLVKTFGGEQKPAFQLRVDAFNLFNRAGLGSVDTNISDPTFGQILNNEYTPRILQLTGRIRF